VTDLLHPPSAVPAPPPPPAADPPGQSRFTAVVALAAIAGLFALATLAWGPWALFFIGALLLSVFLHEMGHFLAAKQAGMKVTEFFLGFGPRLWSFRRGETEYGIKPIPGGAYVKIIGMNNLEEVDADDEGRTYREKGFAKRLRVVLAGPMMNLAIAFVLLFVLNVAFGTASHDRWSVASALPGTAAASAGVEHGDRVVSLAGQPVVNFDAFGDVIQANAGKTVEMVVERDGQQLTLTPTIGWALDASGASAAPPLESGDTPLKVNGTPVSDYEQFVAALGSTGTTSTVEFDRTGSAYRTTVTTPAEMPPSGARGFLGVKSIADIVHQGLVEAVGSAGRDFGHMVTTSIGGIGRFFSPSGLSNYTKLVFSTPPQGGSATEQQPSALPAIEPLEGAPPAPVSTVPAAEDSNRVLSILGVIRLGSQAGAAGASSAILLLALVNLFLGLINLVPLLPFDGGHAAIATYEAVRGRIAGRPYRADIAKLMPVAYAVLVVFIFIGVSSIYLDAVRPAANPFGP
jgi:RIP metalloprotease RseP